MTKDKDQELVRVRATDQTGTPDTTGTSGEMTSEQVAHKVPSLDPDHKVERGEVLVSREDLGPVGVDIDGNVPEPRETEREVDDRPAGNAGTDDWMEYRLAHGYTEAELEGKGRDDLRDLQDR